METRQIKKTAGAQSEEISDGLQQTLSEYKDTAQEWLKTASETTSKAAEATDKYVRDNPWAAVGAVAVAGLFIGFLLGRSRD